MKKLKLGEFGKITKAEANKGIAWILVYIAAMIGFMYIANSWGWF